MNNYFLSEFKRLIGKLLRLLPRKSCWIINCWASLHIISNEFVAISQTIENVKLFKTVEQCFPQYLICLKLFNRQLKISQLNLNGWPFPDKTLNKCVLTTILLVLWFKTSMKILTVWSSVNEIVSQSGVVDQLKHGFTMKDCRLVVRARLPVRTITLAKVGVKVVKVVATLVVMSQSGKNGSCHSPKDLSKL